MSSRDGISRKESENGENVEDTGGELEQLTSVTLTDLPWDDVIFQYILPLLPVQTLFILRRVNTYFHHMIREYFSQSKGINIARIAGKMTAEAFKILTIESYNLIHVNLRNAKSWLTDSLFVPLVKSNPRLYLIDLTYCTSLTNASMQAIAISCPELCTLVLRDCVWLSPEGISVIGLHCTKLENLDISGCWNVNDEGLIVLVMGCQKLKSIQISKIYGITDNSLSFLARNCPHLVYLNVQGCWRITDDSVRFMPEYCKKLKMLQIQECHQVTEWTLSKLREQGVKMDRQGPPSSNIRRIDQLLGRFKSKLHVQT